MAKNFWADLPRPIVALAPMDGYTDSAFRRICKQVNPAIVVYTEFSSADGLHYGAKKVQERFDFSPDEQPIVAQIFGKNVETFITAARWLEQQGFAGIDINMGCPSKKVVKSEHGIALRRCHSKAFELVAAVANATSLPVSVKTRLGWECADDLVSFGIGVQNAGAQLIAIHGRTYTVPYGCPANFDPIYELKSNLSIPVIGNGGITSIADGLQKIGNLDGIMIGQAAFGNPWVFDPTGYQPTFIEKIPIIKQHVRWLAELKGPRVGLLEIRKHLLAYVRGIAGAVSYRSQLVRVESIQAADEILDQIAVAQQVAAPELITTK